MSTDCTCVSYNKESHEWVVAPECWGDCTPRQIEELESHILCLKEALEVEVELFGSRTHMACALRTNIINSEKELEGLKSGSDEFAGERNSASMEDRS